MILETEHDFGGHEGELVSTVYGTERSPDSDNHEYEAVDIVSLRLIVHRTSLKKLVSTTLALLIKSFLDPFQSTIG